MANRVLIVDDEKSILNALEYALSGEYRVTTANNIQEFEGAIACNIPDIALVDLKFGRMDGLELVRRLKELRESMVVIVITAYGTIETSIQAIKNGAYDYILKPIELDTLRQLLRGALKYSRLQKAREHPQPTGADTVRLIGESPGLRKVKEMIARVKDRDIDVLILGDSGTGKELVARKIHLEGRRGAGPFVAINCGALPEALIESELFGYVKGAFTGADKDRTGAFAQAHKGTLFLDEIGEMSPYCQVKLLRAIQEKEVTPLGGGRPCKVDVRIIAATNRNLQKEAESGSFRQDLYYRLNVVSITVPPLSQRMEDIPLLAHTFLEKANRLYGLQVQGISESAMELLKSRRYNGNIRELENTVYRSCILCDGDQITVEDIDGEAQPCNDRPADRTISVPIGSKIGDAEKQIILQTLEFAGGNKNRAAKLLGISERSLYYKLKAYTE